MHIYQGFYIRTRLNEALPYVPTTVLSVRASFGFSALTASYSSCILGSRRIAPGGDDCMRSIKVANNVMLSASTGDSSLFGFGTGTYKSVPSLSKYDLVLIRHSSCCGWGNDRRGNRLNRRIFHCFFGLYIFQTCSDRSL